MLLDNGLCESSVEVVYFSGMGPQRQADCHPDEVEVPDVRGRKLVENPGRDRQSMNQLEGAVAAFEAAGGSGGDRPVLVGLPPGARHEIASLAFATAARRSGIPVVYLGPAVPAASWVAADGRTDARAIAMGIVREDDAAGGDPGAAAPAPDEARRSGATQGTAAR